MFITRATRHDKSDLEDLLMAHGWTKSDVEERRKLQEGVSYIARDGGVVGCVRLVEVEPGRVVVDDVLVAGDRREEGIGRQLMRAAMNAQGGTMYLACHEERLRFYSHFGFEAIDVATAPAAVVDYWRAVDDYPTPEGHVHFFLKAR
jgi:N-acetylglutamate synthase-like GNAT family acetyltransferase